MWVDATLILFYSFISAILNEIVTWYTLYKTDRYKYLKNEVEKQCKLLEKNKKITVNLINNKQLKKKLEREEDKLKSHNRELSLIKIKSMIVTGIFLGGLLSLLDSIFGGKVVAKLPFVPLDLIQSLTHRNLPGNDFTDCSYMFFYILCAMSIRQNVQKFLGFGLSRDAIKNSTKYDWTVAKI